MDHYVAIGDNGRLVTGPEHRYCSTTQKPAMQNFSPDPHRHSPKDRAYVAGTGRPAPPDKAPAKEENDCMYAVTSAFFSVLVTTTRSPPPHRLCPRGRQET